jgi:hypothetical protein
MKKDKISRRDFIKLAFTSIGAFLASCMPRITQTPTPTFTPSSTNTSTPEPTSTNTPPSTPTETPTPTEIPCFHLLTPENGAKLPAIGTVTFSWEIMQGATRYQIQFTLPSGQVISFDTENTNTTRYIESFIADGIYLWQVIALNNNGAVICTAEPFTFEKPVYVPPQNNGGGGDSGNGGGETVTVDSTSTDGEETTTVDSTSTDGGE